jgi:DNA-binding NarL/FixJ family response regulator
MTGLRRPARLSPLYGPVSEQECLRAAAQHVRRGSPREEATGLCQLADFALQLGRPSEAEGPAREAAELARSRWRSEVGDCLAVLCEARVRIDAPDVGATLVDAEQLIDELEKDVGRPQVLRARGLLLLRRGDTRGAIATLEASAALARSQHALIQLGRTLAVLAEAARQYSNDDGLAQVEAERAAIIRQIGPEVRGLSWARGVATRRRGPRVHSTEAESPAPLSPREREVADLITQGLTDRQIAEQLVITEGTAGVHVGHILNKLGFHTRAEIASWAVEHGLSRASNG